MLGNSLFRMYWRISELTVKTLLMEVFTASTPTSSGNYKAFLESFPVEQIFDTPKLVLAVKRNTKCLARLNIRGSQ
jgi:hypothetical protein